MQLLQMVLDGRITVKNAGELMGVSYRHAKRLRGATILMVRGGERATQPPRFFAAGWSSMVGG